MHDWTSADWMAFYLRSFIGKPYLWGGDDPMEGFDCSGLIVELMKSQGMLKENEDLTAQGIYERFKTFDNEKPTTGSLVFFGKSKNEINHVGICINNWQMIEAGGGNSKTKTLEDAKKQNAFIKLRPINKRQDVVAFVLPPWQ